MKTILLAVMFTGTDIPTTENFIAEATEQLSFKYDKENFKIAPLEQGEQASTLASPSEAIFALLSVLTTQSEKVTLSKKNNPTRVLEIAKELAEANNWPSPREGWENKIEFPSIKQEIQERKKEMVEQLFRKETKQADDGAAVTGTSVENAIIPAAAPAPLATDAVHNAVDDGTVTAGVTPFEEAATLIDNAPAPEVPEPNPFEI